MLFSEIYSAYYNTVAAIIASSQQGSLDSDSLFEIVKNSAFPESVMTIPAALESGKWPLIKQNYTTNIKNPLTMPLSLLQKQWLKSILNDKRIKLFLDDETLERLEKSLCHFRTCSDNLEEEDSRVKHGNDSFSDAIEPLFTENDFYLYDQYSDGDPYDDESYVQNFKTVKNAVHGKKKLKVEYAGREGRAKTFFWFPLKIEYSQKDDKFRVISKSHSKHSVLNIARIRRCEVITQDCESRQQTEKIDSSESISDNFKKSVTLEIYDERKALERVMLAFSHFEKSAVQVSDEVYQLTLNYDTFDETELVINVLSFGPMVKVLAPESFKDLIKERISKQMELMKRNSTTTLMKSLLIQ